MAGLAAGLALCAGLTAGDYGTTLDAKWRVERTMPGWTINERGLLARHSLGLGAGVKFGSCALGEVALRKKPKARRVVRVVQVVATGVIMGINLRQGR